MTGFSLWNNGLKGKDYTFIDSIVGEYLNISGTQVNVYMYEGTYGTTTADGDDVINSNPSILNIQDPLLLENRDRKYNTNPKSLKGHYTVTDNDLDLKQFGAFFTADNIFIEFHINKMIQELGRRIVPGDVLELPHLRDDTIPGEEIGLSSPAINKFYEVEEASRATDGYSATWFPHIWRVKVIPMTNTQEFSDILNMPALNPLGMQMGTNTLADIMTTTNIDMAVNDDVIALARQEVSRRYYETRQFYVVPGDETGSQYPWVFAGDGVPPNGAVLSGSGSIFPTSPTVGSYYLRTDMFPHVLYKFNNGSWEMQETDYRIDDWNAANSLLETFINNNNITTLDDGTTVSEKQMLHEVIRLKPGSLP